MKALSKLFIIGIVISAFIFTSISVKTNIPQKSTYIRVIYFHTTKRCQTCLEIEKNIKKSLDQNYSKELKSHKITWESINYETDKSVNYVEKFKLINQSLILIKYKDGKEVEWKDCANIWQLTDNDAEFIKYVAKEVKSYLKGI